MHGHGLHISAREHQIPYRRRLLTSVEDAFELYHKVKEENGNNSNVSSTSQHLLKSIGDGLAGSTGASISNVITYPLDLIITRLQIQRQLRKNAKEASEDEYKGLIDAAQKIYNNEGGLKGFYAGILSDTGKTIADSFIFFLLYDYLRKGRVRRNGGSSSLSALEELGVGFVAGATTKLCTTPIANVATRQQAAALANRGGKTPSFMEIATNIRAADGPSGFWSGYSASLILTLNPSLTFFLFEFFKRLTLPHSRRENPPASATFFLAALSKACASSVTYPFSLAKARLQAGNLSNKKEEEDEEETVEKNIHSSSQKVEQAEKKAAKNTLFSTFMTIYTNEGPTALYEGLHLEVLKAFVSHGITMSVKQFIARLISQLSYTLSIIFSRYTTTAANQASRLAERAKDSSVGYYDLSIKRVNDKVQEAASATKGKAHEVAEFVHEYVEEEENGEDWKDLYGTTGLSKWLDERFTDPEK
ncbi:hypothetical protein LTR70_001766 [Exophiala xenobiotica]|uniref:Mitochondrial carrier protein n=1 Tax=Lithohypha guttulata TaxID=1690604 RepID=A0ABR0KM14_9EURO|nr:hypothetical protein LTR24_001041 [Lithohypha guttulata]KAK5327024.1 hypothetical protein LTR70_001766 [Exophiala xenobiotica]